MFHKQKGFTLIELIVVIVIVSILAVGSVQFISFSARGYVDTARRSVLASTATILNEKITRALRDALPNSIRINAAQNCIEYIPVLSASRYIQAPIVGNPDIQTEVHTVPLDAELNSSGYLAIYPVVNDVNTLYTNSLMPGVISSQVASVTGSNNGASVFTFLGGGSFQFLQSSPHKRLFVTGQPRTFCLQGNALFFYQNYGFVGDIANLPSSLPTSLPNRLLIANNVTANSVRFNYVPSSLRRNALVSYEITLQNNSEVSETLQINQEVQIRNVP
jgi:MSHA biogenesis protein MshO